MEHESLNLKKLQIIKKLEVKLNFNKMRGGTIRIQKMGAKSLELKKGKQKTEPLNFKNGENH